MPEEILINFTPQEARVALIDHNQLQEIYIERNNRQGILGNIYKGRVSRLAPGMQAAFIDVGLERSAFLHSSDMLEYIKQPASTDLAEFDICHFLKPGQEILVQVYKDTLGTKGARLTTQFGIPSRYLVLTPGLYEINVSQKITSDAERERLQGLLKPNEIGGYIFRTVAEGVSIEEITTDKIFLDALWLELMQNAKQTKPGQLLYHELPIELRVLRDFASPDVKKIIIDDKATAEKMQEFAARYIPHLAGCIEYYFDKGSIFDLYAIEDEIQRSLDRRVHLKSGGHIIIDQTEAMTTIDINTGSYLGKTNSEQTVFQTNLEAVYAIARQVRLRNLGGIIIIDFIDMVDPANRRQLLKALMDIVAKDAARVEISELSSLGLVQMTRKRTRESLEHILCDPCPTCQKRGSIKSVQTVCYEIFREIKRLTTIYTWPGFTVNASQEVINYIENEEANVIAELATLISKPIKLKMESSYGREQHSVLPLG